MRQTLVLWQESLQLRRRKLPRPKRVHPSPWQSKLSKPEGKRPRAEGKLNREPPPPAFQSSAAKKAYSDLQPKAKFRFGHFDEAFKLTDHKQISKLFFVTDGLTQRILLVDTGASVSIWIQNRPVPNAEPGPRILAANGQTIPTFGYRNIGISLKGNTDLY